MARSTYIYLIFETNTDSVVSAHTVKREAHEWAERSQWSFQQLQLYRTRDNGDSKAANPVCPIPWDDDGGQGNPVPVPTPWRGPSVTA